MYEFEWRYASEIETEELWTWCSKYLKDSFWFRPKDISVINAGYEPLKIVETYYAGPIEDKRTEEERQKPYILYIKIRKREDAVLFKMVWV